MTQCSLFESIKYHGELLNVPEHLARCQKFWDKPKPGNPLLPSCSHPAAGGPPPPP